MPILYGHHATCESRADEIKLTKKFQISAVGLSGPGIYFWRCSPLSPVLSKGWYEQSLNRGRYSTDLKKNGKILKVKIKVKRDELLDLEKPQIKDALEALAIAKGVEGRVTDPEVSGLIALFVEMLEKNFSKKFKTLQVRVSAPNSNFCKYPSRLLGAPLCYVVLDAGIVYLREIKDLG